MNKKKEIIDELRRIAPDLPDFKARNAMSVPDGYFEKMTSHVMGKIEEDSQDVEKSSGREPTLPDFKSRSEMSVPDGYFEQMTSQVLQKVQDNENAELKPKQAKIFSIQRFYKIGAAAAITAVLIAGWFLMRPASSSSEILAEFTSQEAYEYAIDNLEEFSTVLNEGVDLESIELDMDLYNEIPNEDAEEMIDEILEDLEIGDLNQIM